MITVKRTALVTYTQKQMYDLVNDVDAYHVFLPWCQSSKVIERNDNQVVGELVIAKAGIKKGFVTRNTLHPFSKVEINLEKGPFKRLHGFWLLHDIQGAGTKLELDLEFEFEQNWMGKMLSKIFANIADSLVQAFCERADQLYG